RAVVRVPAAPQVRSDGLEVDRARQRFQAVGDAVQVDVDAIVAAGALVATIGDRVAVGVEVVWKAGAQIGRVTDAIAVAVETRIGRYVGSGIRTGGARLTVRGWFRRRARSHERQRERQQASPHGPDANPRSSSNGKKACGAATRDSDGTWVATPASSRYSRQR